jgi:intracellular sulfur oxidation DsrE/DsrF family protein
MPDQPRLTLRRSFLARLGVAVAGVTASATTAGVLHAQPGKAPNGTAQPPRHPLDAWMDTLGSAHRLVLDATSPAGAVAAVMYGWNFLRTSSGPYGLADKDHGLMLVLRHDAMIMALPQALWAKYPKVAPAPFLNEISDVQAKESVLRPGATEKVPDAFQLDGLAARGVHFAICQTALDRNAGIVAREAKVDVKAVIAEFTAALPANSHVMPSGITAVQRAQEYGFSHAHTG